MKVAGCGGLGSGVRQLE